MHIAPLKPPPSAVHVGLDKLLKPMVEMMPHAQHLRRLTCMCMVYDQFDTTIELWSYVILAHGRHVDDAQRVMFLGPRNDREIFLI